MFPRFAPSAYALLRIIAGLMFALHGSTKLLGFPERNGADLVPLMAVAGTIELVGGLMIALGLFASIAAFVASGEMAAAYFMAHAAQGGFWPTINHGELAVLYCFVFLYIAATGPGIWSVTKK